MVFEDPSRKRWRITLATLAVLIGSGAAIIGLSYAAIIKNPFLPQVDAAYDGSRSAISIAQVMSQTDSENSPTTFKWEHQGVTHDKDVVSSINNLKSLPLKKNDQRAAMNAAFLLQEDIYSVQSLSDHSKSLDMVFPDWFYLTEGKCDISAQANKDVTNRIKTAGALVVPTFMNAKNGTPYTKEFQAILRDESKRDCLVQALGVELSTNGAQGLNVDIETLAPEDDQLYLQFLVQLQAMLHKKNMVLIVTMPAGSSAYHPQLIANIADGVLVMIHGQHYAASKPGPLASQAWFESALKYYTSIIPREKLMIGMGSYGYDWNLSDRSSHAKDMTYADIMALAVDVNAKPEMDPVSRNMLFGYRDEKGKNHIVWFLDGIALYNQWTVAAQANVAGVGVWRLGSEDPNIWSYLGNKTAPQTKELGVLPMLRTVNFSGDPEVYRFQQTPQTGHADIILDAKGAISRATYTRLPSGYLMERAGQAITGKNVVLTFNDSPNQEWTPQIIALLQKYHAPAVFFIRGDIAEHNIPVLKSLAEQKYVVGNQGYGELTSATINPDSVKTDANTTQRIIENTYKRHTSLFRIPYSETIVPNSLEQMDMVKQIADLGYVFVRPTVYTYLNPQKSSETLASEIIAQLEKGRYHIVTFDNSATSGPQLLATLNVLLPELQKNGYAITGLPEATHIAYADMMPAYNRADSVLASATGIVGSVRTGIWPFIFWVFLFTTVFSFVRLVFMIIFVSRSLVHGHTYQATRRKASILIPAYNEEKTIAKTLASIQESTHRYYEVLVIDDGSTDRTADIVRAFAQQDSRIRLIRKENGGKASALNIGIARARYSIVVTIDGDTIMLPNTIRELVKPFSDPKIDAVCGNVEVGNIKNMLTGFQALEYITAQNFDRRAFDELNAISVVPGATGAWRRDKIMAIGGYHDDTLAEDADLTLRLLAAGGKIVYAPAARSQTEAPESFSVLAKQRFRWAFGTFQCLGKHHKLFFKQKIGWIALPNIFIFQIIFPLLAPLGDIAFLICLIRGQFMTLVYSYIAFTIFDVIGSIFAFRIERKPYRLIGFALIQRFFYRQFMYLIILQTIIATLRGRKYTWGKMERTGSVAASAVVRTTS